MVPLRDRAASPLISDPVTGVTVVVPTRGQPTLLREALASVSENDVNVIVVEDGTRYVDERELRQMVRRVRLLQLPYVGRSRVRNAAVDQAETPFVAFLDADDVSLPGRFERQAAILEMDSEAALCCGRVDAIDGDSQPLQVETAWEEARFDRLLARGLSYESLLEDCPIYTSATMVRRDAFLAVGGYREELDAFEDLDLYLRLSRSARLVACDGAPVARHRKHSGNTDVDYLYAGSLRLAELHLADGAPSAAAERLLREREIDALWALGDFRAARRRCLAALRSHPQLLARRGFRRRLLGSALPLAVLQAIRQTRR